MAKSERPDPIPVVYFQRKPRSVGNYSVEYIFDDVRLRLREKIEASISVCTYESNGVFKRLYNCLEVFFRRGPVNHITGDVNYLALLLSRRNTVSTFLDLVHLESSSGIKYWFYKYFWLVLPERHSKFITAISESTKMEILKHHQCSPEKIIVIPVAISPAFRHCPQKFNRHKPRILQVGAAPNKNIPRLIEALANTSCVLNIVGKVNEEYVALCKEKGVELIYETGLSNEEMISRYESCDIVALVSTYEGFGMPILEAQAVGRAVVSSNRYSMPEVAGGSAVLVDPTNVTEIRKAILQLIEDDNFREERISKGLENIKRFDPDLIAGKYLDLYKTIYFGK